MKKIKEKLNLDFMISLYLNAHNHNCFIWKNKFEHISMVFFESFVNILFEVILIL